jgi:hypothetical protein
LIRSWSQEDAEKHGSNIDHSAGESQMNDALRASQVFRVVSCRMSLASLIPTLGYAGLTGIFAPIGDVLAGTIFVPITLRPIIARLRNGRLNGRQYRNYWFPSLTTIDRRMIATGTDAIGAASGSAQAPTSGDLLTRSASRNSPQRP